VEKMHSRNTIVTTVLIFLLLSVLISGCIREKKANPAPESINKEAVNVSFPNHSSKEENMPEINIESFSSIYMHDNSEQKDIYLFSWENVPGNESHRLRSYLRDYHQINWVEKAQITKDDERKIIRVFTNENSIEILLYKEGAKINLGKNGSSNLCVKEENGTHTFYNIGQKYQNKYDISSGYYANAVDVSQRRAAILIGHPKGGTIAFALQAVIGRRIHLILPVGLEKRISGNLDEIASRLNAPGASSLRLLPVPGDVFTEIEAITILSGANAELVAGGGVCGAEGSIWLAVSGGTSKETSVKEIISSILNEPSFELV